MGRVAVSVALAVVTTATSAAAEGGGVENIRLDYVAKGACPSQMEFEARVTTRTARARFAPSGEDARVFDVRVDAGPPARGSVVVRRAGALEGKRDVRAETCADVADALALVLALAVDPTALSALTAPPPPPPPPTPAANEPPPAPALEGPMLAPIAEAPVLLPRSEAPALRPEAPRRAFSFDIALAGATGTAPSALFGASPRVGWMSSSTTLAAAVRVGFLRATTGELDVPGGSADFTWTVGHVDACAVGWPTRPARLAGCAHVEGGALEGTGIRVPAPRTQSRGWVAAGPLLRGEWTLFSPMFVEAEIGAVAHIVTDRFYFLPDTTAYRVPLLGASASVGVGVFFL